MSRAPILLEHEMACGVHQGRPVQASILRATAAVLFARGADEILVPVPTATTREAVGAAVAELPDERRSTVRLIDPRGSVLQRVDDFLEPLTAYARKWPEEAFVGFSRTFLYQLVLATEAKASIAADSIEVVRDFVPILDLRLFRGEGRYRLAELINLIATYDSVEAPQGVIAAPFGDHAARNDVLEILESIEFRRLTATSGLLGYLTEPRVALRRLARLFTEIIQSRRTQHSFGLAASVADTGAIAPVAKGIEKLLDVGKEHTRAFAPPFLPLDISKLGIYRVALDEAFPSATPPPGTVMVLERTRGGVSWLNEGEEDLRYPPLVDRLNHRKQRVSQCRLVQQHLYQ